MRPSSHRPGKGRTRRFHPVTKVALAVVIVLVAARIVAPFAVRHAINRRLSHIPNYSGQVNSVSLHVWRGAYRIDGMNISRSTGKVKEPFFSAERIDFSLAWRELFHRKFLGQITVTNGHLTFLRGPDEASSQLNADKRWQEVIQDIFPIDITYLDIKGGVLRFIDTTKTPQVDIAIKDLNVHATGLKNRIDPEGDALSAEVSVSGETVGGGRLKSLTRVEPLAAQPHFSLSFELDHVSLPALNNVLRAYGNVDVSQGTLRVVAQTAMLKGHYEGYVKPFIDHLDMRDLDDEKKPIGQRIWKSFVAALANLAKNKTTNQIATRIPFSGDSGALDIHTWKSVENALHHGFVRALTPTFEGTTNPDGVVSSPLPSKESHKAQ